MNIRMQVRFFPSAFPTRPTAYTRTFTLAARQRLSPVTGSFPLHRGLNTTSSCNPHKWEKKTGCKKAEQQADTESFGCSKEENRMRRAHPVPIRGQAAAAMRGKQTGTREAIVSAADDAAPAWKPLDVPLRKHSSVNSWQLAANAGGSQDKHPGRRFFE